ncbi:MAG: hypothetical protein NC548_25755 [Lachnospiraceae bacterium]|nr:hypothetical protein [Lachnospiraceae bacterium]
MYGVYNTLAFRDDSRTIDNFKIIRSSVIANYLDIIIAGTGMKVEGAEGFDFNSFLVVNGKFYPIISIIQAYLEDVTAVAAENRKEYGSGNSSLIYTSSISRTDNKWVGDKDVKDLTLAIKRSDSVKGALAKTQVIFELSGKRLRALLNKHNV